MKVKSLSRVRLLAAPWTAAYQAPPPMGFSRQEYWSGVPLPSLYSLSLSLGIFLGKIPRMVVDTIEELKEKFYNSNTGSLQNI